MIINRQIIDKLISGLHDNDADFFKRIWGTDINIYSNRLRAIGFEKQGKILDAGFGMGQWLIALSELNEKIFGIEYAENRVTLVQNLVNALNINNIDIQQGTIEDLPFEDDYFDAVFCYGVIFLTDFRKSLKELHRVLKPRGKIYFTSNDLGWFVLLILEEHNKTPNYDPRMVAIKTIENSISYFHSNSFTYGSQLLIPARITRMELEKLGFSEIQIAHEGTINHNKEITISSFYKGDYLGLENVYEVIAKK